MSQPWPEVLALVGLIVFLVSGRARFRSLNSSVLYTGTISRADRAMIRTAVVHQILPTEAMFRVVAVSWAAEEAEIGRLRNRLHFVNRLAFALLLSFAYAIPGATATVLAIQLVLAVIILFANVVGATDIKRLAPYVAKYGPVESVEEGQQPEQGSDEGQAIG
jgi:hypothetical protein